MEAADLGESETDVALVAREEHRQVRVSTPHPRHLALLAVHKLVTVGKVPVPPPAAAPPRLAAPTGPALRAEPGTSTGSRGLTSAQNFSLRGEHAGPTTLHILTVRVTRERKH
eukprot:scaffold8123_cov66-Phaeocystis_antarctica.AAC.11